MTATNTIKMTGLKKAAGATKGLNGYCSGEYIQVSYDTATGQVLADYHYNLGQNSWTQYHDPSVITIGNLSEPTTMRGIRAMILDRLAKN